MLWASIYHTMDNNVRMNSTTNYHHYHHKHTNIPFTKKKTNFMSILSQFDMICFTLSAATATPPRAVDIDATVLHVLCSMSYLSTVSKHVESSSPPTAYNGPPRQPTAIPRLNQTFTISFLSHESIYLFSPPCIHRRQRFPTIRLRIEYFCTI